MTVDLQPGSHKERDNRPTTTTQLTPTDRKLLLRLAHTLQTLTEATDPRRSSEIGGQTRSNLQGSEADEGAATRGFRNLQSRIRREVNRLCDELDSRVEGSYQQPAKREKVRCVKKSCTAYGKRVPRWIGPRSEIDYSHCSVCGNKVTTA